MGPKRRCSAARLRSKQNRPAVEVPVLCLMAETRIRILAVSRDSDEGIIVTFSDGTSDGFVTEELLELRPHRPPVQKRRVHSKSVTIRNANALNDSTLIIELSDGRSMALTVDQILALNLPTLPSVG